jgi:hypothetical protein
MFRYQNLFPHHHPARTTGLFLGWNLHGQKTLAAPPHGSGEGAKFTATADGRVFLRIFATVLYARARTLGGNSIGLQGRKLGFDSLQAGNDKLMEQLAKSDLEAQN